MPSRQPLMGQPAVPSRQPDAFPNARSIPVNVHLAGPSQPLPSTRAKGHIRGPYKPRGSSRSNPPPSRPKPMPSFLGSHGGFRPQASTSQRAAVHTCCGGFAHTAGCSQNPERVIAARKASVHVQQQQQQQQRQVPLPSQPVSSSERSTAPDADGLDRPDEMMRPPATPAPIERTPEEEERYVRVRSRSSPSSCRADRPSGARSSTEMRSRSGLIVGREKSASLPATFS